MQPTEGLRARTGDFCAWSIAAERNSSRTGGVRGHRSCLNGDNNRHVWLYGGTRRLTTRKEWLAFLDDLRIFCLSPENQITILLMWISFWIVLQLYEHLIIWCSLHSKEWKIATSVARKRCKCQWIIRTKTAIFVVSKAGGKGMWLNLSMVKEKTRTLMINKRNRRFTAPLIWWLSRSFPPANNPLRVSENLTLWIFPIHLMNK